MRFRCRYSLRTALLAISFIGVVVGAWQNCRERAVNDVMTKAETWGTPKVVAPFLIYTSVSDNVTVRDRLHFWLGGPVMSVPFGTYPEPSPVIMVVQPRIIFTRESYEELPLFAQP